MILKIPVKTLFVKKSYLCGNEVALINISLLYFCFKSLSLHR